MAAAVRAAVIRVIRRLADAGTAGGAVPPGAGMGSMPQVHDAYRSGFSLPLPSRASPASTASDPHECPWCRALGSPDPPGRSGRAGGRA